MTAQIIHCEQGTDEWFAARLGIPTASEFHIVLAAGKGAAPSKTRKTYMLKLLGERLTGKPQESYTNAHMERGKTMEEEARSVYAMIMNADPTRVGFVRSGETGCSPDSLIGENGLLEIKTKLPHLQLEVLFSGEMPEEHKPQVQGQIWITGREWCDFMSYWPGLRPFIRRIYRDDDYIKLLSDGVNKFNAELAAIENKYRSLGGLREVANGSRSQYDADNFEVENLENCFGPPNRPAEEGADLFRNQCDGCQQVAPLRDGLHIDKEGHAFMACQKQRYEKSNGPLNRRAE